MNLWPVEHFFPHFLSRSELIWKKKWGQKCSTGQSFICTEVTSYKIYILIEFGQIKQKVKNGLCSRLSCGNQHDFKYLFDIPYESAHGWP